MTSPIEIDIWTDVSCPWCFIGKQRLEAARDAFATADPDHPELRVTYHSFQIAPDLPESYDGTVADFLRDYEAMPSAQVAPVLAQVTAAGREVGLDYDFGSIHQANTHRAHELVQIARAHGLQSMMLERLYQAYFLEGRHLGQIDELVALAEEVGLDHDEVRGALEAGTHAAAVAADIELAGRYGIRGVPYFVVDHRFGMSGAQQPEAFVSILERVTAERRAQTTPS